MVGRGYHDDAQTSDPKTSSYANKVKDRRRVAKSKTFCSLDVLFIVVLVLI